LHFDVQKVRQDFPILNTGIIYLDNAASSLTPEPVVQKMVEYYHEYRSNVERGLYKTSQRASEEVEKARAKIASFINSRSDSEIIFTKNSTESVNIVANGLTWRKGEKIITTLLEHHSNFIVWLRVKQKHCVNVDIVHPDGHGLVNLSDVEKAVNDHTKLVAVTHVSNVLGVILPIKEIVDIAHDHGALVLVDGAQSVPHLNVDVQRLGCDFLVFSGHKMCGPTGIGVLYIKQELLDRIEPLCIGGGAISDVGADYYRLEKSPAKFEAGTPPIAEAIGLGAAVDYLKNVGMKNIENHERNLTERIFETLINIPNVRIYGPEPKDKVGIISFNVGESNPHDVALAFDVSEDIMVRSGHHCAMPLVKDILKENRGTVRASTYLYNTEEEVEKFTSTLSKLASQFA